ncbi:MAG: polyisoprenoid-binding protein [Variovorax sp.]|nr:MAG: polyisoprenoid-binding protein [Variovorax sp.]
MNFFPARVLAAALLSTTMLPTPAQAQPARYELDPEHITVAFLVDHIGYAKVLGMFRAARGSYSFDEATAALTSLRIEVDTQSVFTNYSRRDQHLKSADFLNAAEFPRGVFTASSAKRTGERSFEIAGQFELVGRSHPLTLTATWNKSGPSPIDKTYVMGVSARGSFKRSSYGMNYGVENGWVGDEVPLIIEFEAKRK